MGEEKGSEGGVGKNNQNIYMSKQYQLPREFAEKWVKALRSGEYKQTMGVLGSSEIGYCCLGVAGRICGATDEMLNVAGGYLHNNSGYFNEVIRKEIPPQIAGDPVQNSLVLIMQKMNDSGASFTKIADWIEQNVEFV